MKHRKCYVCKGVKPLTLDYFYRNKPQSEGFDWRCKECDKVRTRIRKRILYKTPLGIYQTIFYRRKRNKVRISKEDFIKWYEKQKRICVYCRLQEEDLQEDTLQFGRNVSRLTIDRKDNERGYEKGNLALACYLCNFIKGNIFTFEEMKKVGKIIEGKRG